MDGDARAMSAWRIAFPRLGQSGAPSRPFRRLIVVIDGPNSSFDYYIGSRLELQPDVPATVLQLSADPASVDPGLFEAGLVLFCRYVSARWLSFLRHIGPRLAGTALFLDDDLPALCRDRGVPLLSRARLFLKATRHWPRLAGLLDLVIVSTPVLAGRLGNADAAVGSLRRGSRPCARPVRTAAATGTDRISRNLHAPYEP